MTNHIRGAVDNSDAWTAYTPTYSTDIGAAAASFTGGGAVTTTIAKTKLAGAQALGSLRFNAVTLVVTPAYIQVSLPADIVPVDSVRLDSCPIKVVATWETGQIQYFAAGYVRFYRANRALFPVSSVFECSHNFVIQATP